MNVTYTKTVRDDEGEIVEIVDVSGIVSAMKAKTHQLEEMLAYEQKKSEDLRELLDNTRRIALDMTDKALGRA